MGKEENANILSEIGSFLMRFYRIIAAVLLILFIAGVIGIDWYILGQDKLNNPSLRIWESVESLLVHFMPLLVIFLFIKPLTDIINKIRDENKTLSFTKSIELLHNELQEISPILNKLDKFPEIEDFESCFENLNWKNLLDKAVEVDICLFYTSSTWNQNNLFSFGNFFKRDGILNIYLPNPISISDQFSELIEIKPDIASKILRTAQKFRAEQNKIKHGSLNINFLDKGFNYMYARIKKERGNLFLYSPYQNFLTSNQSPVIIINENKMQTVLDNFIVEEIRSIKTSTLPPNFEKAKYLIWDEPNNRVFISDSLSCPANCKFCYTESIVDSEKELSLTHLGSLIAKSIVTDTRFKVGKRGTTILLGGFSDPFLSKNSHTTIEIIKSISQFENFIHIATRYGIEKNDDLKKVISKGKNIIINYSFSCLDEKIELANFENRFAEAKELLKNKVKVALYIRPVLPQITLRDIPELIKKAKAIGIKDITVGGLYVDERIKKALIDSDISFEGMNENTKTFILDNTRELKKVKNNDVEKIKKIFSTSGFHTFSNTMEIVNHFRDEQ